MKDAFDRFAKDIVWSIYAVLYGSWPDEKKLFKQYYKDVWHIDYDSGMD